MAGKSFTDDLICFVMGNDVIELEANALQIRRMRMDPDRVVIVKRCEVVNADFDNGIYKSVFFDFPVGIGGIPHQGGPAELEIPQVIAMVDDLGTIGIGIHYPAFTPVPHLAAGSVFDVARVTIEYFGNERFRSHLHTFEYNTAVGSAEAESIGQKNVISLVADLVGDHVDIGKFGESGAGRKESTLI